MATHRNITADMLAHELVFTTSRSGGPGGQHVNKVSSKVTLHFDVKNSGVLNSEEKETVLQKLTARITRAGILTLTAQETKSQIQNKEAVMRKLEHLLEKALARKKRRKATKPTKAAARTRLKKKKTHGEKKRWRRKPGEGEQGL